MKPKDEERFYKELAERYIEREGAQYRQELAQQPPVLTPVSYTHLDLETGGGLRCTVLADNGLDIGRLTYRGVPVSFLSKNGIVSPYAHHPFEEEFLHTFPGGMLYTCGLLSAGPAGRDGGVWQPMHGRYPVSYTHLICGGHSRAGAVLFALGRGTTLYLYKEPKTWIKS